MSRYSTPTGDRAKSIIRKIDRWLLKQEGESTIDWAYQDKVEELEDLYASMQSIDQERKRLDAEERRERRLFAIANRKPQIKNPEGTDARPTPTT
jgi:hypothetical protein